LSEEKEEHKKEKRGKKRPSALIKASDAADGCLSNVCILRNFRIDIMIPVLVEKSRD
jgi:hypothetical protein